MRFYKGYCALIGLALLLQACGSAGEMPATITEPSNTTPLPPTEAISSEFFTDVPMRSGFGFRSSWFELYFTDPVNPLAAREVGGVDAFLSAAIVAARESIDIAVRNLNLDSITGALIVANRRGIPVRVVAESESMAGRTDFQDLKDAGIVIVEDQQPGLMNNRFVIIDHKEVWTGSLNYDPGGVFREYNTLVRIVSPEVAADYTQEFNEMFENHQFGSLVAPQTPYPVVDVQGTRVEVLFSPDDIVVSRLTQLITEAQENISFLVYSFASEDLGTNIRTKATNGVTIGGVLEFDPVNPNQSDPNPNLMDELNHFRQAGLNILLDRNPEVMHHKMMVIDGRIVVLGSYDFTKRAETDNDENVLIIHNEMIAQKFMEEFQRVQSRAQP
ncbi:MAG TPA: phospholipase D-like domain-containing protein [Anaerolineales bacterium]|nr:phospholipase D-like domain-containing protein [Anaerolineales bacterium]